MSEGEEFSPLEQELLKILKQAPRGLSAAAAHAESELALNMNEVLLTLRSLSNAGAVIKLAGLWQLSYHGTHAAAAPKPPGRNTAAAAPPPPVATSIDNPPAPIPNDRSALADSSTTSQEDPSMAKETLRADSIIAQVYSHIGDKGVTTEHLAKATGLTHKQCADQTVFLHKRGLVKRINGDGGRLYLRTAKTAEITPANNLHKKTPAAAPPPSDKPRRGRKPAAEATRPTNGGAVTVADLLQRAITNAQQDLDDYIKSIGDPAVLEMLRDARDAARERYNAFVSAASESQ